MPISYTSNKRVNQMAGFSFPKGVYIPNRWFQTITDPKGRPDPISMFLLSHIVYQYIPYQEVDPHNRQNIVLKMKFDHTHRYFQTSYKELADMFGETRERIKGRLDYLEDLGVIKRYLTNERASGRVLNNCLNIDIIPERLHELTDMPPAPSGDDAVNGLDTEHDFEDAGFPSSQTLSSFVPSGGPQRGETLSSFVPSGGPQRGGTPLPAGGSLGVAAPPTNTDIREYTIPNPNPIPSVPVMGGRAGAPSGEGRGDCASQDRDACIEPTGSSPRPTDSEPLAHEASDAVESDADFERAWAEVPPSKRSRRSRNAALRAWRDAVSSGRAAGGFLADNYIRYVGYQLDAGTADRYIAALSTWLSPKEPMEGWSLEAALAARDSKSRNGEAAQEADYRREREDAEYERQDAAKEAMLARDPTARELYRRAFHESGLVFDRKEAIRAWSAYFKEHMGEYAVPPPQRGAVAD